MTIDQCKGFYTSQQMATDDSRPGELHDSVQLLEF